MIFSGTSTISRSEFGDLGNILAYLSIGDRQREVERLVSALAEIKRRFSRDKSTLMDFDYIDPIVADVAAGGILRRKRISSDPRDSRTCVQ